jgi:hypothetical protein
MSDDTAGPPAGPGEPGRDVLRAEPPGPALLGAAGAHASASIPLVVLGGHGS